MVKLEKPTTANSRWNLMPRKRPSRSREFSGIRAKRFLQQHDLSPRDPDGFMIQGGGFEPGMNQKPTRDPIKNEADNGLKNDTWPPSPWRARLIRIPLPHSSSSTRRTTIF